MTDATRQNQTVHENEDADPPRRSFLFYLPLVAFIGVVGLALWGLGAGPLINRVLQEYNLPTLGDLRRPNPNEIPSVLIGRAVPDFALQPLPGLKTLDGKEIPGFSSEDLKGRVTLVNVWASWCVSCREEHESLMMLSKDPSVRLAGLNYKDKPTDALRMLSRAGNPYQAVGMDSNGRVGIDWGVYGVPETFIVDAQGRIRGKHIGPIYPEQLAEFKKKIEAARVTSGSGS